MLDGFTAIYVTHRPIRPGIVQSPQNRRSIHGLRTVTRLVAGFDRRTAIQTRRVVFPWTPAATCQFPQIPVKRHCRCHQSGHPAEPPREDAVGFSCVFRPSGFPNVQTLPILRWPPRMAGRPMTSCLFPEAEPADQTGAALEPVRSVSSRHPRDDTSTAARRYRQVTAPTGHTADRSSNGGHRAQLSDPGL